MKLTFSNQVAAKQRGIALIIVMVVVVFLGILAGGFAYSMKVETTLARNSNLTPEMEWAGRAGIEMAKYILAQQVQISPQADHLGQKWAGGSGNTNDVLADINLADNQLGHGKFTIKIIDCERKMNINIAPTDILNRALTMIGVDASDISTISDSIADWIDTDDRAHIAGAESDYYLGLNPPYYAKNGPVDDVTELLMIRGVTPEIYWGTAGPHHDPKAVDAASSPSSTTFSSQAVAYTGGLWDVFTAVSAGQLNINTASAGALQLLPGIDEHMAENIMKQRAGPDGMEGTEDDTPFMNVQQLLAVPGLNPALAQQLIRYITVRSTTFEVQVDVEFGSSKRRYYGLLRRNSGTDIQLLHLHWD